MNNLSALKFNTPLGLMIALSDQEKLYLLKFIEQNDLNAHISQLQMTMNTEIVWRETDPLQSIQRELKSYFAGSLFSFKTSVQLIGTFFQKNAWDALVKVPFGKTKSYAEQALSLGKPTAFRAVANANAANPLAIIIPCHRIINSNGKLGGYAGGIEKKKWLLDHESRIKLD
jgi:AraC family transcriptional regulator of adaptative response/methylated-DNA-[protein]-cysteine methyltransferase